MASRPDNFQIQPALTLSAADVDELQLGIPRDVPVAAQPNNGPNNEANGQAPAAAHGNARGRAPRRNWLYAMDLLWRVAIHRNAGKCTGKLLWVY